MRYLIAVMLGVVIGIGGVYGVMRYEKGASNRETEKLAQVTEVSKPLLNYTIESLGKRGYETNLTMDEVEATESGYFVQKFHFDSDGKKVTGLAHFPKSCDETNSCPVIVQVRGYADPQVYYSGYGTAHSAEKLAEAGFISLAPDFLGYGDSANPSSDVFEARFETYTTVLNLLAGINQVPDADASRVGVWGHSNGGQIALTVLEITEKDYPTVLWAPVSAGFPYSILYFMNDNSEGDKQLRRKLADFEDLYDSGQYSLINYLDRIEAPIQLHQGTADKSVPVDWSRTLEKKLKKFGKDVTYFEYPGADHNLMPDWGTVVDRSVAFFKQKLGLTD